jgi:DNA-binding response OmpR family regulator
MAKIMLIEDDLTMRTLLKALLEFEGHKAIIYSEVEEDKIINVLRQEKPDVLLLDVHLNKANGLNILKAIRLEEDLKEMRVIMSSGMDLRDQCMKFGASGFLLKPYMPDELLKMISPK